MPTLAELIDETPMGKLNDNTYERFGIRKDKYNLNNVASMRQALSAVYSNALKDNSTGPYEAICLAASNDPTNEIPLQVQPKTPGFLLRVIARIPEFHASLPKPDDALGCVELRNLAILMHPVFYSVLKNNETVPKPGNKIKVNLFSSNGGQYGEYLGIVNSSESASPSSSSSPEEIMNNSEIVPTTLEDAPQYHTDEGIAAKQRALESYTADFDEIEEEFTFNGG
jgi:hypothetical protein